MIYKFEFPGGATAKINGREGFAKLLIGKVSKHSDWDTGCLLKAWDANIGNEQVVSTIKIKNFNEISFVPVTPDVAAAKVTPLNAHVPVGTALNIVTGMPCGHIGLIEW